MSFREAEQPGSVGENDRRVRQQAIGQRGFHGEDRPRWTFREACRPAHSASGRSSGPRMTNAAPHHRVVKGPPPRVADRPVRSPHRSGTASAAVDGAPTSGSAGRRRQPHRRRDRLPHAGVRTGPQTDHDPRSNRPSSRAHLAERVFQGAEKLPTVTASRRDLRLPAHLTRSVGQRRRSPREVEQSKRQQEGHTAGRDSQVTPS